jgi:hypothetical protein
LSITRLAAENCKISWNSATWSMDCLADYDWFQFGAHIGSLRAIHVSGTGNFHHKKFERLTPATVIGHRGTPLPRAPWRSPEARSSPLTLGSSSRCAPAGRAGNPRWLTCNHEIRRIDNAVAPARLFAALTLRRHGSEKLSPQGLQAAGVVVISGVICGVSALLVGAATITKS